MIMKSSSIGQLYFNQRVFPIGFSGCFKKGYAVLLNGVINFS